MILMTIPPATLRMKKITVQLADNGGSVATSGWSAVSGAESCADGWSAPSLSDGVGSPILAPSVSAGNGVNSVGGASVAAGAICAVKASSVAADSCIRVSSAGACVSAPPPPIPPIGAGAAAPKDTIGARVFAVNEKRKRIAARTVANRTSG